MNKTGVTPSTKNSESQITSSKLEGTTYPHWSKVVEIYIQKKPKLRYMIGGSTKEPEADAPKPFKVEI